MPAVENPYTRHRVEAGYGRIPDAKRGWFGQSKIYFNMFICHSERGKWRVTGEEVTRHFSGGKESKQVVFYGSGIAWMESIGGLYSVNCPPDIYNALNACISVITANK